MKRLMLLLCFGFFPMPIKAAQIFSGPNTYARIGSGLDSASSQWRTSCLDGTIEPSTANRSVNFKVYAGENAEEILEDQRGYGSIKVDFWVVGAKARSEFILRNTESETQSSVLWSLDYRGGSVLFNKDS